MQVYSDSTIFFSDQLFDQCNDLYVFEYDSLINYNTIRVLRSQTYVRLGDFDSAKSELNNIEDLNCDFNIQTVVECLNSLESE